jgi:hypothetical protein
MSADGQNITKNVTGGTSSEPTNLDDILDSLEGGEIVLFAQGSYKLTSSLSLASGVTLVIEGDVDIDGGGNELTVGDGRISISAAVSEFGLNNITVAGGVMGSALITVESSITDPESSLAFNASGVTLKPDSGSSALSFGRTVTGERNISEPPRVYRRAKLSENCPSWNRIERRPQSRIHLSSARVRCGLSRSIATNIEATQQRMLRSPANWAVRQTVFASGCVRPNVMVASGRDRPVLRRLVSKSLNARTGNCVRPMRS